MTESTDTDNVGEKAAAGESQPMPDRAEEKRVDVPQNETPAPVEDAQATDAAPTQEVTAENSGQQAEPSTDASATPDNA